MNGSLSPKNGRPSGSSPPSFNGKNVNNSTSSALINAGIWGRKVESNFQSGVLFEKTVVKTKAMKSGPNKTLRSILSKSRPRLRDSSQESEESSYSYTSTSFGYKRSFRSNTSPASSVASWEDKNSEREELRQKKRVRFQDERKLDSNFSNPRTWGQNAEGSGKRRKIDGGD